MVLPLSNRVSAITPLTRAEIQSLRNIVQLIPKDRHKKRPARKSDAMTPGDGLSTGRASLADLRFNDGSLARVGEQAIFQFLPKTRSFRLSNGTALLLIPPGRGQTRIQTPSAAAAIRGSALFVRYNKQTDTTIVGALTNSGIEVFNKEASQSQVLQAGQMMVIVKGKFQGLYDFDLRNFYETSDMVRGLDLTRQNLTPTADPAIASVQAETAAALNAQSPIIGEGVVENPSFVKLTTSPSTSSTNDIITDNSPVEAITDDSPLNSFQDIGQVLSNTKRQSVINGNNNVNTQNNKVGVDFNRTLTTPQNPSVQSTGGGSGTTTPEPTGGGSGTTTPEPTGGGSGTTTPEPTGGGSGTTTPEPTGGGSG
ncbi:FecR domain-containing protein, partial [Nostoc sp. DedVER01b]|uniref:FecR domain-containing protein n=1 Tax=Nostoc sp. DedVER01b TaxID=3075404 RepID=UPI003A0FC8A8